MAKAATTGDTRRVSTPPPIASKPFVTQWSTIGFGTTAMSAWVAANLLIDPKTGDVGTGLHAVLASLLVAVVVLASLVSWFNGIVLAQRARSLFWTGVVVCLGPAGSIACALWCRPRPPSGEPS